MATTLFCRDEEFYVAPNIEFDYMIMEFLVQCKIAMLFDSYKFFHIIVN